MVFIVVWFNFECMCLSPLLLPFFASFISEWKILLEKKSLI